MWINVSTFTLSATTIAGGEEVAVKLELSNSPHPQLQRESKIYKSLSGVVGIPNIRWYVQCYHSNKICLHAYSRNNVKTLILFSRNGDMC